MPDVVERIRFIQPQQRPDFLWLAALCDVMLDPIHFGGGNTTFESLALGVPVVTLPSGFLRGRITLALYREMNFLDCVVANSAQYADLAVRLGTDEAFRGRISAKILQANSALFECSAGIRQLEEFLVDAVEKAADATGVPGPN